jgi:hypothetical protein
MSLPSRGTTGWEGFRRGNHVGPGRRGAWVNCNHFDTRFVCWLTNPLSGSPLRTTVNATTQSNDVAIRQDRAGGNLGSLAGFTNASLVIEHRTIGGHASKRLVKTAQAEREMGVIPTQNEYVNFCADDYTWVSADASYFYFAWCDRSRTFGSAPNIRPDADVKWKRRIGSNRSRCQFQEPASVHPAVRHLFFHKKLSRPRNRHRDVP